MPRYRNSQPRLKRKMRRAILNTTSRKKQDTMMTVTNVVAPRNTGNTTYTNAPALLTGGAAEEYSILWCATARAENNGNSPDDTNVADLPTRTATACYMRGLRENIEMQCTDGLPWQWRRICFQTKSRYPTQTGSFLVYGFNILGVGTGVGRVANEVYGTSKSQLYQYLFTGQVGIDWVDPLIAKTDKSRNTICYDKTITLACGNEDGFIRKFKRWHGMNKTLIYDDDESGGSTASNIYASDQMAGMGDYFIIDIIRPRDGSTSSNRLSIRYNSTLYWHEK